MMQIEQLSKSYGSNNALSDISLEVRDDEYVTLLGPSGSGKSTLLRIIAGLEKPDNGRVVLDGRDITSQPAHLRGLGIVQQSYALFPHLSVYDNIAFGLRFRKNSPVTDENLVKNAVTKIMNLVGLGGLENRSVGAISGGQKQRVSLARTLVTEPKICLLDEPLGALDANLRSSMTTELRRIQDSLGVAFLHVTGNETEALSMGDRTIVLDAGHVISFAKPDTLFDFPSTVRAAKILNAYTIFHGTASGNSFQFGNLKLPVPFETPNMSFYAVRYDEFNIVSSSSPDALMQVNYLTQEFTGSSVTYFVEANKQIIEVVSHISTSDPIDYNLGEKLGLRWSPNRVLLYDANGVFINQGKQNNEK